MRQMRLSVIEVELLSHHSIIDDIMPTSHCIILLLALISLQIWALTMIVLLNIGLNQILGPVLVMSTSNYLWFIIRYHEVLVYAAFEYHLLLFFLWIIKVEAVRWCVKNTHLSLREFTVFILWWFLLSYIGVLVFLDSQSLSCVSYLLVAMGVLDIGMRLLHERLLLVI